MSMAYRLILVRQSHHHLCKIEMRFVVPLVHKLTDAARTEEIGGIPGLGSIPAGGEGRV